MFSQFLWICRISLSAVGDRIPAYALLVHVTLKPPAANVFKMPPLLHLILVSEEFYCFLYIGFLLCVCRFGVQLVNMWSECTGGIFSPSGAVAVRSLWFSFRHHWKRVAFIRLGCKKLEFHFRSRIQTWCLSSMNVLCVCVFIMLLILKERKQVGLAVT
jgi:phosphatidylserine synthase